MRVRVRARGRVRSRSATRKLWMPRSRPATSSRAKTIAWLAVRPSAPGHHLVEARVGE